MRRRTKKFQKRFRRMALFLCVVFAVLYSLSVMLDFIGYGGGAAKRVTIEAGSGTKLVAESLRDAGVIAHPTWFRVASKLFGHDGSFQQGVFSLKAHSGYGNIFQSLKSAPRPGEAVSVTIPEGYELRQIADLLEEKGLINRSVFYDLVEHGDFDYDFLKELPKRENRLEGYLFPDTYLIHEQDDEKTIIGMMLARFDEIYNETYQNRAKELGLTNDELITLASVIEREAQGDHDRKNVASVFHNRLKSREYPYLESCATVQYILKERKPVLSTADTKINSPYNTYQNPGLPIGPIASPGKKSIEAALYPNQTDYLFFVLDASGKHHFSKTFSEHLQHVN